MFVLSFRATSECQRSVANHPEATDMSRFRKTLVRIIPILLVICLVFALTPSSLRAFEGVQTSGSSASETEQAQENTPQENKPKEEPKKDEPRRPPDPMSSPTFMGLRLRSIGPAFTSGRVCSIAVDPTDTSRYFAGAASGGIWKTTNAGTTWTPVFDNEGSYSIGTILLDPKNPLTVWVGTGENNSQRSVSYGDGVYRSDDGGKSWKNVGLKASER